MVGCQSRTDARLAIDSLTLADLEVFGSRPGDLGLLPLLDRTRTRGGHAALRQRLEAPFSQVADIVATQDALRFLECRAERCAALLGLPLIERVERYLTSRYASLQHAESARSSLSARWTAIRYPDLVQEAREGTATVASLMEAALGLVGALGSANPPPVVAASLGALSRAGVELGAVLRRHGRSRSPVAVLRLDAAVRGPARPHVRRCLDELYALDAVLALAEGTRDLGWTFPEVVPDGRGTLLVADGLCHPLLSQPVANDVRLDADSPLMFLTGPNMAGKTTLMRSVGLAVYLGQLGVGVPARSMRFAPFAAVVSSISPLDSARLGCSHFLSEVRRLRSAAETLATGERTLLLFDEVFRGTNFHDALDASEAVVAAFARCRNGATIISSHAAELLPRISGIPGVALRHFDLKVVDGAPRYSYRLEPGAYTGRLAMVLLQQERLTEALGRLPASRGGDRDARG